MAAVVGSVKPSRGKTRPMSAPAAPREELSLVKLATTVGITPAAVDKVLKASIAV